VSADLLVEILVWREMGQMRKPISNARSKSAARSKPAPGRHGSGGIRTSARSADLLAPVYDWFTEGFDTLDLKKAKALLEELGPTALESNRTDYSLRLPLAGFRCCKPLPNTSCFLKNRIVPGARPLAVIRRRPAPVSA
jgi:hypothetical protein